jgi:hypothetical protein
MRSARAVVSFCLGGIFSAMADLLSRCYHNLSLGGDVKTAFKFIGVEFLLEARHPPPDNKVWSKDIQKPSDPMPVESHSSDK